MPNNQSIIRLTLGYVMVFLLLACNSKVKQEADPIKIEEDVPRQEREVSTQEKTDSGSHPDTIVISGMVFHPAELHIKKGDTVVWINRDIVVHDASEFPNKKWTSGPLENGSSWKMKVDKSYDYFCSIHITMKGKVIVD